MTNAKRLSLAALVTVGVTMVATSASADPTKADDRYGYVFEDDLLSAGGSSMTAVPIHVQRHLRREVLIRPRVQFVSEMLKSVEAL